MSTELILFHTHMFTQVKMAKVNERLTANAGQGAEEENPDLV